MRICRSSAWRRWRTLVSAICLASVWAVSSSRREFSMGLLPGSTTKVGEDSGGRCFLYSCCAAAEVFSQNFSSPTSANTGLLLPPPIRCTGKWSSCSQRWTVRTPRLRYCAISFQEFKTFGAILISWRVLAPRGFAMIQISCSPFTSIAENSRSPRRIFSGF